MSRPKLINDWKQCWRLYSVQFGVALALVPELLFRLADALGQILPALPPVVLEYLPPEVRAALAIAGLVSVALRLVSQINLRPPKEPDA